jgi:hypothetical protein
MVRTCVCVGQGASKVEETDERPVESPAGDELPLSVTLLDDEPAEVDEFGAKGHEQVAQAIADLVRNESGGKVVGLEGSWGSGKSTVVRLLKEEVETAGEGSPDTRVVVFDAWAHQDDPLRRTFLETLIDSLHASKWLSRAMADELLGELTGKHSKVHTTSTSSLSREGQFAAGAAALIPLGVVLVSNHLHAWHRRAIGFGVVLLVLPVVVVLVFWLAKQVGVRLGGDQQTSGTRHRLASIRPFSFFAKDQDTDTKTDSIEHGDPTSVEFETLFSRALDAALRDDRRLVIVLDNIDRVDEETARAVLATMQTFTGFSGLVANKAFVWTLIPYDPDGLDRFGTPASVKTSARQEGRSLHKLRQPLRRRSFRSDLRPHLSWCQIGVTIS